MASKDPAERKLIASIGAHEMHARYAAAATTAKARASFEKKFLDEVDPDRVLDESDRLIRAAHARSAHFKKLALLSAQARRRGAA